MPRHSDSPEERPHLEVNVLGLPQILVSGRNIKTSLLGDKAVGLLTYLMMGPSHGFSREHLVALFWPETDEERGGYNLRRAIWALRKAINPSGAPLDFHIGYHDGYYIFRGEMGSRLDVHQFQRAVAAISAPARLNDPSALAPSPPTDSFGLMEQAHHLYRGPFLQGCHPPACEPFLDWLDVHRNQVQQGYIQILRMLTAGHSRDHRYAEAVACCEEILTLDPLQEAAYRDLMFLYYQTGKRDVALECYQSLNRLLQKQLGVSPVSETETLYREIRDGTLQAKGESYLLPGSRTSRSVRDIFVGRETELERLADGLSLARVGQSRALLIEGEPGIGKTRLVEQFLSIHQSHARNERPIILRGQCFSHEQELPYHPFIDALRDYFSIADFDYIAQLNDLWLAEVARLLPEIYQYLPRLPVSVPIFLGQEKNRLFEGIAQFITHLSQRQAVVLFLDDFHATDRSTLDLVHYLVRRLSATRTLFLGTIQPELAATRAEIRSFIQALQRTGQLERIPLGGFSQEEALAVVRHSVAQSSDLDGLGAKLYSRAGGNPFFLQELLKAREDASRLPAEPQKVPPTVSDFILQRLSGLDAPLQDVLRVASVFGYQFDSGVLELLYAPEQRRLADILEQLVTRRWVIDVRNHMGRYEFSHGLVQEAIYQSLRVGYRQELHRRVGTALEQSGETDDEQMALLAAHFWKADDVSRALPYFLAAADHARNLYANQEALAHYRRALDIIAASGLPVDTNRKIEISLHLASVCGRTGRYEEAVEAYVAVLPLTDLSCSTHRQVYFGLADIHTRRGDYNQALGYLRDINEQVTKPAGDQDWLDAVRCARGMGQVYLQREQSHQALVFCAQARSLLDTAEVVTAPEVSDKLLFERIAIYEVMGDCYFHLGHYQDAVGHYEQALSLGEAEEFAASVPRLHRGLSRVDRRWGNYSPAEEHARRSLVLSRAIGDVAGEAASYGALGDVAYNRGNLEQSLGYYQRALDTFLQIGDQHRIADYYISLSFVLIDLGEIDEACRYLEQALEIGQTIYARMVIVRANYHLSKVAFARGDIAGAEERVSQVIDLARGVGIRLLEAMGLRLLGEILSRRQQLRRAEACLDESLHLIEILGDQFETAWTLRTYARVLSQTDRPHARAQLERALSIFARLGASRELSITQRELNELLDNSV